MRQNLSKTQHTLCHISRSGSKNFLFNILCLYMCLYVCAFHFLLLVFLWEEALLEAFISQVLQGVIFLMQNKRKCKALKLGLVTKSNIQCFLLFAIML